MTAQQALDKIMDVARRATMVSEGDGRKRVLSAEERAGIEEAHDALRSALADLERLKSEACPAVVVGPVVVEVDKDIDVEGVAKGLTKRAKTAKAGIS